MARLLCEDDDLRRRLDVTLFAVPVADPDGFVLNEGWFEGRFSPLHYARHFHRPPHREQVEWTFPVDYKTLRFPVPTCEAATVMRVMQRVHPTTFYSLHNAGFCGVYFYVSHERPELHRRLHELVAATGQPLHRGEPEVPYLRTLAPAVYGLFGIADTYEYLARTLGEDPAPIIQAGTSSDDWLRGIADAFSIVCELPYYTAPALDDARPSDRLWRSVADYVAKAPKRIAAERANPESDECAREATIAEACDAIVCTPFLHLLYLGEMGRVAARAGDRTLAERIDRRLETLADTLGRASALRVLPIEPLVRMQTGAGLLALACGG